LYISYLIIGASTTDTLFIVGVIIFFIGFNMHEPIMQSLTTRYTKVYEKGKVLGVFNSFGYLGTFVGGFVGGLYFKEIDGSFVQSLNTISMVIVIICILWLGLILTLPNPNKTKNLYINLDDTNNENHNKLDNLDGCVEWYVNNSENIIIIKYNSDILNKEAINNLLSKPEL
jgi:MFS family permease